MNTPFAWLVQKLVFAQTRNIDLAADYISANEQFLLALDER
jgi:hypothetical protein